MNRKASSVELSALERGRQVLADEAAALQAVAGRLDERFERAVAVLAGRTGKVVATGVGKSGLIARKIAATLTSTGTPAYYLHAVDALHGDLGLVEAGDVALVVSNSGAGTELEQLLPLFARLGRR
jgi:arabinose-5-phosphate isomerase